MKTKHNLATRHSSLYIIQKIISILNIAIYEIPV